MKYNINKLLIPVAIAVLLAGCSESFLDLKPVGLQSTVTFYNTFAGVDATVTAAYAELCAREVFDKDYYLTVGSIAADDVEAGGENLTDYPAAQHFDQFTHTFSDDGPLAEIYRYCYKGCRMANTALENLATIKEIDPEASDALIAQRIGEMKFMRALYHFMLVQVFGGVPIADKVIGPEDFSNPRNTIKEVIAFIEQELEDAILALPEKSELSSNDVGRATKGAAQALLAKALMYESGYAKNYPEDDIRFEGCQERWEEALEYADAVIEDVANYSLVGAGGERYSSWRTGGDTAATIDGYRWLFTASGDNSSESIFEIQSVSDGLGYGATRGNVMTVYQTVRRYTTPTGFSTTGGWSFNCPTQHLISAFQNNDPRESNLHSSVCSETVDPRFATTVGREGDSILVGSDTTFYPMNFSNLPTGTIGRKFECGYSEFWGISTAVPWEGPFNVRLLRLADILLLAAEAAIETGDNAKALDYVNRVRSRARACGETEFPQDLTEVSFEDVVHERRLELACEPQRFFDLVRWGLAEEFLEGIPNVAVGGTFTVVFEEGKHEFFPLPLAEVQISNGALVQYEPWQ